MIHQGKLMILEIQNRSPLIITLTWKPARIEPSSYGQLTIAYELDSPTRLDIAEDLVHQEVIRIDERGEISRTLTPTHQFAIREQYEKFQNKGQPLAGQVKIISAEESDFASSTRVFQFLTIACCQICHDLTEAEVVFGSEWLNSIVTSAVLNVQSQHASSL